MTGIILAGKQVPGTTFLETDSVDNLKVNLIQSEFPKSQKYEELIVKLVEIEPVDEKNIGFLQICDIHDLCVLKIENDVFLPRISVIHPNCVNQKDENFMVSFQCEENDSLDLSNLNISYKIESTDQTIIPFQSKQTIALSSTLIIPIKQTVVEKAQENQKIEAKLLFSGFTGYKFSSKDEKIKIEIKINKFIKKIGFDMPFVAVNRTAEKINIPISMQPENIIHPPDPLIATGKLRLSNDVILPLTSKNYLMVIKPVPREEKEELITLTMQEIDLLQKF